MQTLVPTAVRLNNLSGSVGDIDESPDSPDANWCKNRPAVPQWWTDLAESTWIAIADGTGEKVRDVLDPDPGGNPEAICGAWTGGCVDQSRAEFILAANGGHSDYGGNEVYALNLRAENPAWVRLTDASTPASGSTTNGNEMYADGNARAVHGWNRCVWGNGRVWYGGMAGMYSEGYYSSGCTSFDRDSIGDGPFPIASGDAPWAFHGRITLGSGSDWEMGNAIYDPVTKYLWACAQYSNGGNHCYYVDTDAVTPAPVAIDIHEGGINHTWGVIPHNLGRVWITKNKDANSLGLLDLENPSAGWTTKTVSFAGVTVSVLHGAVYHAGTQAIYCWHSNGTSLIKVAVPSDLWDGTYTVSTVTAAAGGATPSSGATNGTYSRFNIVQDIGDGRSALVLLNDIDEATYVYKLPAS